ncbi:MAG: photosystem II stability/assembly factor-like uncharacterized protein [Bradymonadia bacterium]
MLQRHSAILPPMRALLITTALLCALPALAQRWHVEDMTNAVRFDPPITCIDASPSDPLIVYAGSARGRIYFTRDGGRSWEETAALTASNGTFTGAWRGQFSLLGRSVQRGPAGGLGIAGNSGLRSSIGQQLAQVPRERYAPAAADPSESIRLMIDGAIAAPSNFSNYRLPAGNREAGLISWFASRVGFVAEVRYKSLLSSRVAEEVVISWLSVHPRDPMDVLAGSSEGVMRSRDGGFSWPSTLSAPTPAQRFVNVITRNQNDPDHVLVGTRQGLHMSRDGGDTFSRLEHPFVATDDIRTVVFDPRDAQKIYVGATWALLYSRDGGQNFEIMRREADAAFSFANRLALDPQDPARMLLGTRSGLALSTDGGATFRRTGGPDFIGEWITSITATGPRRFLVTTWRDLWETSDGGRTFRVVLYGGTQWSITQTTSAGNGAVWMTTEAEMLRLSLDPHAARVPTDLRARFSAAIAAEPALNHMIRKAQTQAGVWRGDLDAHRNRAQYSHFLPRLTVDVRGGDVPARFNGGFTTRLPITNRVTAGGASYGVFGRWDLRSLLWRNDQGATALYRLARQNRDLAKTLRTQIIALYQERRRLILDRLITPRPERRTQVLRDLRFEELTAHLNALTGDALPPFSAL